MIIKQERKGLLLHLATALYIATPMFSKIERNERPAKRTQVVAAETLNNTNIQA